MLEKMDLKKKMESEEAKKILEEASEKLGRLQRECKDEDIPVLIVFEGMGAAGKGVQINRLIQALDPRGFHVYTSDRSNREERLRPFLWRYWTKIPEKGRIVIFDRSWYRSVQADRFDREMSEKKESAGKKMEVDYYDIRSFEKQLTDGGMVLIKIFLAIDKKEQKKRFRKLMDSEDTAWRVSEGDLKRNKEFEKYEQMNEEMLVRTDTDYAPWNIVEATDRRFATAKIYSIIIETLSKKIKEVQKAKESAEREPLEKTKGTLVDNILAQADLTKTVTREEYKERIEKLQDKIEKLHGELYRRRIPVVLGFEGWDAGGKGGAVKRLTAKMDPRGFVVHPTASPNDIERAHHYLWRFWTAMPKAGHVAIFDRTWYGRVMVERLEGFCSENDWKRAYNEINEFEKELFDWGAVIIKFWVQIDKDTQLARFTDRQNNPEKQWKITDEDWRNREKWDAYEGAVDEMLAKTSTTYAPWHILESVDKKYARIKALKIVIKELEKALERV